MPALESRAYGKTGEHVTVIGLGGACLNQQSHTDGVATVRRALELGVTYFDTAPAYGRGASQVILGEALEGRTERYLLATKLGYLSTPAAFRSPDTLRAQFWENLRALRRDSVDVLQVHLAELACWWEDGAPPDQILRLDEHYDFANAPAMQVLREARAQGRCRFIGITADHAEELAYVLRHVEVDAFLVAYDYNLLFRRARRSALPLAREKGVAYIAAGIFKPGLNAVHPEWLSSPPSWMTPDLQQRFARLYDIQRSCGLSIVTLSVRYLVNDPSISTILVGASTPSELEESVAAAQAGPLSLDLHQAIEALGVQ